MPNEIYPVYRQRGVTTVKPIVVTAHWITDVISSSNWSKTLGASGHSYAWDSSQTTEGHTSFAVPPSYPLGYSDGTTGATWVTGFRVRVRYLSATALRCNANFYEMGSGTLVASAADNIANGFETAAHSFVVAPPSPFLVGAPGGFSVQMTGVAGIGIRWFTCEVDLAVVP